jgi:hypothetical protein
LQGFRRKRRRRREKQNLSFWPFLLPARQGTINPQLYLI